MSQRSFTYWTVGRGTRYETRKRRCNHCGSIAYPSSYAGRFGPCPCRRLHGRPFEIQQLRAEERP